MIAIQEVDETTCIISDNSCEVRINVAKSVILDWFWAKDGNADLQAKELFCSPVAMNEAEWLIITDIVQHAKLPDWPTPILQAFASDYRSILLMPYRVYGGGSKNAVYVSHPLDFHKDHRCDDCRYCLLSADSLLIKTWINLDHKLLRYEIGSLPGHFLANA